MSRQNPEVTNSRRGALVVLPTYNERENLGPITDRILAATAEVDVLIVDDSSPMAPDGSQMRSPRAKSV